MLYNHCRYFVLEAKQIFFKDHYLTMSNIDRSEYYNIKFQEKPLMIWIWISVIMITAGGLISVFKKNEN